MSDEQGPKPLPGRLPPIEELTAADVVSKVYDLTDRDPAAMPIWLGDLPGPADTEKLRAQLLPGTYLVEMRAAQGNNIDRQAGTIVQRGIPFTVPGERIEEAEAHLSLTNVPAAAVTQRPAVTSSPSTTSVENSAVHALVDLVRELSVSKQPQTGAADPVLNALEIMERLQALTIAKSHDASDGPGNELATQKLGAMFDEGINLGKKIGGAAAASEGSEGESKGNAILAILERVLAHPTITDMVARASAPVVNLDELTAAKLSEETGEENSE